MAEKNKREKYCLQGTHFFRWQGELTKSDEDLEFLDEGVVEKVKKKTSRLCRVDGQTPCWKFFEITKGDESVAECNKCSALITCVDKRGKLTTTALNTHFQSWINSAERSRHHIFSLGCKCGSRRHYLPSKYDQLRATISSHGLELFTGSYFRQRFKLSGLQETLSW